MKAYELKKIFLEDRPSLKRYLEKIDFSLNQVISIEALDFKSGSLGRALPTTKRFVFKGIGFVFNVDTDDGYSFFRPELKFNEIQTESQAG